MQITILGTGMVGKTLAEDLSKKENDITVGTRDPNKDELKEWASGQKNITLKKFKEASDGADLIIVAVNYENIDGFFEQMQGANLDGKTIIDLTNPLELSTGKPELAVGFNNSLGEIIQNNFEEANVVKALNIITASQMIDPQFEEGSPDMFIAGNNDEAKMQVTDFLESVGWRVIDMGDIKESRLLEALAMIWIKYAMKVGTWTHGFSLLRK